MIRKDKQMTALQQTVSDLQGKLKILEEKLSMGNSALRSIVSKSLDAIAIVGQEQVVVHVNYAAVELFDRKVTGWLGEPLGLEIDVEDSFQCVGNVSEMMIAKEGNSQAVVEVSALKAEWSSACCHIVSFQDITGRKKPMKYWSICHITII